MKKQNNAICSNTDLKMIILSQKDKYHIWYPLYVESIIEPEVCTVAQRLNDAAYFCGRAGLIPAQWVKDSVLLQVWPGIWSLAWELHMPCVLPEKKKKKWPNELIYKTLRLTDIENRPVLAKVGLGEEAPGVWISRGEHRGWMRCYHTAQGTHLMACDEPSWKRAGTRAHTPPALFCTTEANTL